MPLPCLHELAKLWDSHENIRSQMRSTGKLLTWSSPAGTGVANRESLKLNRLAVQLLIQLWVKVHDTPKSPPIKWIRQEAGAAAEILSTKFPHLCNHCLARLLKSTGGCARSKTKSIYTLTSGASSVFRACVFAGTVRAR